VAPSLLYLATLFTQDYLAESSMFFMPFHVIGAWLRALFTTALLGASIFLLTQWYNHPYIPVTVT